MNMSPQAKDGRCCRSKWQQRRRSSGHIQKKRGRVPGGQSKDDSPRAPKGTSRWKCYSFF